MEWGRLHAMFWYHLWVLGVNFHGTRVWVTQGLHDILLLGNLSRVKYYNIERGLFSDINICTKINVLYNFELCQGN